MSAARYAVALTLLAGALAGCGDDIPDYQSIWTTTHTSAAPTSQEPVPIHQYLESVGVVGRPVPPDEVRDFTITLPTPPGWQPYHNPNFAPGTRVIAKGDTYPIAMLMVFELTGDFDVARAIEHGHADAERSQNFKRLNASNENWRGFPSSMIEGSYDLNGRRMQSYNRIVIPTGPPPERQRYLIQLTVTSFAEDAAEHGPDIETIIRDFSVAPK
ncbi:LpqN/LpqT family lipoprotein [Mycolicibacterium thermoresistibile]|jgi:hypothetical protein|uniref:Lipoprotein LpqN n=2 Tax=Mycolicibacterium thermoresistibile TaxID=1797 RepID=A0A100XDL8_MYCTH|nr:LpqN/LpqT family lipoprotein [Mycolicibacterium thermoresistibile]EHI14410.1 putative lipoprotein [Mycolicibacterium thermoresistibile ATCC 19527]MCV7189573.1 LpqN/LpqT family lipoprotein [Mycolicibacterium thermoresistibile]GAT14564.1 lipoprotein LpqN [Mycolicibacterium thermoresistibile]SNW19792.1 putative lipoprotein [Mycolicibacterium thermoresistibile]